MESSMSDAWQRKEGQSESGGLNDKGRASLRAEGRNIKRPVTSEEAERSPAAAERRDNFRSRMCGMKEKLTSAKTAHDPNSRINLALKKWDVKC
tara:strand:+ start:5668 stop:5949 length:282 start_codon:yes stop_codon:yes gene_type:complete